MANAERGEVGFETDGKKWTLRYTTNSLCELEDHLGKPTNEIAAALQGGNVGMKLVRAVFWGGLLEAHPEADLKLAGDLIQSIGLARAGDIIGEAFSRAFPEPEAGAARPRKGAAASPPGKSS